METHLNRRFAEYSSFNSNEKEPYFYEDQGFSTEATNKESMFSRSPLHPVSNHAKERTSSMPMQDNQKKFLLLLFSIACVFYYYTKLYNKKKSSKLNDSVMTEDVMDEDPLFYKFGSVR